jgi:hypothetical protein
MEEECYALRFVEIEEKRKGKKGIKRRRVLVLSFKEEEKDYALLVFFLNKFSLSFFIYFLIKMLSHFNN